MLVLNADSWVGGINYANRNQWMLAAHQQRTVDLMLHSLYNNKLLWDQMQNLRQ